MLTALSLLYLYHLLGAKQRCVEKSEPVLKMAALLNTQIEEEPCMGQNFNRQGFAQKSTKITQYYEKKSENLDVEDYETNSETTFNIKYQMQTHQVQRFLLDQMTKDPYEEDNQDDENSVN